jgi:hypothetical protein
MKYILGILKLVQSDRNIVRSSHSDLGYITRKGLTDTKQGIPVFDFKAQY